tara:strand:+ start:512 stop:619 length:108 start_codon:yes stop_codon:yes gene_type:complete
MKVVPAKDILMEDILIKQQHQNGLVVEKDMEVNLV